MIPTIDGLPSSEVTPKIETPAPQASEALLTVQRFHELARGLTEYDPGPGSCELRQADKLLREYGPRRVNFILGYALRSAERTNFKMRTFGAVLQYVGEALAVFHQIEKQEELALRAKKKNWRSASNVSVPPCKTLKTA